MSPFVAPIALPFALTLVLYAAGRQLPALRNSVAWPALCAALGFAAGYMALEGLPPLVPVASKQKFLAIAVGAGALPVLAGVVPGVGARFVAAALWALIAALWIGVRRLDEPMGFLVCALLVAGVVVAMASRPRLDRRGAASAAAPMIAVGAGFTAISIHGASASLSLLSAAVAAGAGAIALVAALSELAGGERIPLGEAAVSVFAVVLMAIAAVLIWFTPKAYLPALVVTAFAPVAAVLTTWLPIRGTSRWRALLDPLFALVAAGIPVGIAVVLASRFAALE